QNDDVRYYFGPRILSKGVIGQAIGHHEVRFVGHQFTHARVAFIQRVATGDEHDQTAGTDLVETLDEEIIVDAQFCILIARIVWFVIPERHIADSEIDGVVWQNDGFIATNPNIGPWIEVLSDMSGN